jgi:tetratricopeptide (TPR) repeat protein
VTIYATPTAAITQALLEAEEERDWKEQLDSQYQRTLYLCVAGYVDTFRRVSGNDVDDSDIADMLAFLQLFRDMQRRASNPNWPEVAEALTLHGTLERLYGQHLALLDLKRRDAEGEAFSTPIDLYRKRGDLVGTNADRGHYKRAAGLLDEALKVTRERLDPHAAQLVVVQFEKAALYRDRGEYRSAIRILSDLQTELLQHHCSEKRWIAAAYKTLAIVQRESYRNGAALLNLWAAETFEEASELDRTQTKRLMTQQWKYLVAYTGFQLLLAVPIFLLAGLFVEPVIVRATIAGVLAAIIYPFYLAFFDGIFGILVARWAVGRHANIWHPPNPVSQALLESAARQYQSLSAR